MKKKMLIGCVFLCFAAACETGGAPAPAGSAESQPATAVGAEANPEEGDKGAALAREEAKEPKKEVDRAKKEAQIQADSPDAKPHEVRAIEFDVKDFPGKLPVGSPLGGFAFVDAAGENYVVFTREEIKSTREHYRGSVLRIKHVAQKGDEVKEVRAYTERVEDCDVDLVMKPKFGEWSVSDVDANGLGEASFAYSVGCRGDVAPDTHKVFVTEAGKKYALRGRTKVKFMPEEGPVGGDYKADEMPAAFLAKAKDVWAKTSRGVWVD